MNMTKSRQETWGRRVCCRAKELNTGEETEGSKG